MDKGFFLNPRFWFLVAVLVAPLRAYGWTGSPVGTVSAFRITALIMVLLFVLSTLIRGHVQVHKGLRIGVFFCMANIVFILVTLLYSPDLMVGNAVSKVWIKMTGWAVVILIVLIILTYDNLKCSLSAYVLSSVVPMAIGWYQWTHYYVYEELGRLPFEFFTVGGGKQDGVIDGLFFRPSATFLEPNYYAYFLGSIILLLVGQILVKEYLLKPWLVKVVLISAVLQLGTTLSLSGIMGTLVGLSVVFMIRPRWIPQKLFQFVGIILGICIFVIAVSQLDEMVSGIRYKVERRSKHIDTLFGRGEHFSHAWAAISESYGLGVGFGGLAEVSKRDTSTAHNAILTIFAEQGAFAFITFLAWSFWVVGRLAAAGRSNTQYKVIGVGMLGAFVSVIVGNMAYDAMFSYDVMWVFFGIATACAGQGQARSFAHFPLRDGTIEGVPIET